MTDLKKNHEHRLGRSGGLLRGGFQCGVDPEAHQLPPARCALAGWKGKRYPSIESHGGHSSAWAPKAQELTCTRWFLGR